MADNKGNKNTFAGKVATPKTAGTSTPPAQALPDSMEALGKAIGARIKLTTAAPHSQTYEGLLATADPIWNLVFIERPDADGQTSSYSIVPIAQVQNFQIMGPGTGGFANAQPAIGPIDYEFLQRRLEARVAERQEEERNKGKGVTKEAQAIFDSLKRINMPIRWHNQEMIVHDSVIIAAPYRSEDCRAPKEKQEVLSYVRRALEGQRKKLKEKQEREEQAGQRLGG